MILLYHLTNNTNQFIVLGFFSGDESLGFVKVSLDKLLTKCEVDELFPITDVNGKKALGGVCKLRMKLRTPISGPEVKEEVERELVIGPWPELVYVAPPVQVVQQQLINEHANNVTQNVTNSKDSVTYMSIDHEDFGDSLEGHGDNNTDIIIDKTHNTESHETSSGNAKASAIVASSDVQVHVNVNTASTTTTTTQKQFDYSILTVQEKQDPLSIDFYAVSNDVMDAEISMLESKMNSTSISEEERSDISMRHLLLTTRMNILVTKVQNGQLTMEEYINMLQERVKHDKVLAIYCNQNNMKNEAIQVMKRMRIMENEIESSKEM
jgi:hypothetical protein